MRRWMIVALVLFAATGAYATADFEDVGAGLDAEHFWYGSDGSGEFVSGGATFNNIYDDQWDSWEGFAFSNMTDSETPGYENQYSAAAGSGAAGSDTYAVAYVGWNGPPTVTLPEEEVVTGAYFTNTAYAYWSMKDGDAFSKKFGGDDGTDPDWFRLTLTGKDANGEVTGTMDIYLADFRFEDDSKDYILKDWTWVDLSSLGEVKTLECALASSDNGDWGMNTPAYFALDYAGPVAGVADMDNLALASESHWNGSDASGGFMSGGILFGNIYDQEWDSWEGFAASNVSDTLTAGWGNQYAAITGEGVGGEGNYAVCYVGWSGPPTVTLPGETTVPGVYVTNTTYAYWSMKNGDAVAKKFGGDDGTDPDWFLLTVTGKDESGAVTGTKDFYLADFRSGDPEEDYIVNEWTWLDLSTLGDVKTLEFGLTSSDNGDWGMNTPAYLALDWFNGFEDADGYTAHAFDLADLDQDGTWDLVQSGMKTVATENGKGFIGIDLSGSDKVTSVTAMSPVSMDGLPNSPAIMPYGLVSFTLAVDQPGDTAKVLFRLSEPINGLRWYKYDAADGWTNYSSHATFNPDGTILLELEDGGFGDSDGLANGVIQDPSGPGIVLTVSQENGGGSSGCFVGSAADRASWLSRAWSRLWR